MLGPKEKQDRLVQKVNRVRLANRGQPVLKVRQVQLDRKVKQDPLGPKGIKVKPVNLDLQVFRAKWDLPGLLD
tara:strand:+ start:333 stop:551 length:219 start_codon:yes stop_codon:yes gene_type:complete